MVWITFKMITIDLIVLGVTHSLGIYKCFIILNLFYVLFNFILSQQWLDTKTWEKESVLNRMQLSVTQQCNQISPKMSQGNGTTSKEVKPLRIQQFLIHSFLMSPQMATLVLHSSVLDLFLFMFWVFWLHVKHNVLHPQIIHFRHRTIHYRQWVFFVGNLLVSYRW